MTAAARGGLQRALSYVKTGIQSVFRVSGYQITRYPETHSYVRHVGTLLSILSVNCVIDVGAHVGEFYRLARGMGYAGRIVSMEPVPESFELLLQTTSGDPLWKGYNVAMGNESRTLPMNVPALTGFASFLEPNAFCRDRFPDARWEGRTLSVRMERLSDLYSEIVADLERPRVFLKMDTQGWDSSVLDGAGSALDDIVGLQSEVSVMPLYHGMHTLAESLSHYYALGFEVTALFPVVYDEAGVCVVEYDCVARRTNRGQKPGPPTLP